MKLSSGHRRRQRWRSEHFEHLESRRVLTGTIEVVPTGPGSLDQALLTDGVIDFTESSLGGTLSLDGLMQASLDSQFADIFVGAEDISFPSSLSTIFLPKSSGSITFSTDITGGGDITFEDPDATSLFVLNADLGFTAAENLDIGAVGSSSTSLVRLESGASGSGDMSFSAVFGAELAALYAPQDTSLGSVSAENLLVNVQGSVSTQENYFIDIAGTTSLMGSDLDFTAGENELGTVNASGDNLTYSTPTGDVTLSDIDLTGDLTISAGGSITDDGDGDEAGGDIDVGGTTSLLANDLITLDDIFNDFDSDAGTGQPTDNVNATATSLTLTDIDAISLGDIDLTGDLRVRAGGSIVDNGTGTDDGDSIDVVGATSLVAESSFDDDIVLDNALNDFGSTVTASGVDITLVAKNSIQLGDIDALGTLSVTATGSITDDGDGQAAGDDINVAGVTSLTATGEFGDIVLDDIFNNFDSDAGAGEPTDNVNASATSLTLTDIDAISLGDIDLSGDLTVRAGGSIVDNGTGTGDGDSIDVVGATSLVALNPDDGDIVFDNALNDFGSTVSASGVDITLVDKSAIQLGDIDALGTFSVTANGGITDDGDGDAAGDDINVAGVTSLTATGEFGDIVLDDIFNNFDSDAGAGEPTDNVNASATSLTLADIDAIALGDIDLAGDLNVRAGGRIVDNGTGTGDGESIDVVGTTSLAALNPDDGDIVLDNALNDFGNAVTASGVDITLVAKNSIQLGDIDALGTLSVTATGSITDDGDGQAAGDDINVAGVTSLTATGEFGDILLDDEFNDFDSDAQASPTEPVIASGNNITLNDVDAIILGSIQADGSVTVTTASSVELESSAQIEATNAEVTFGLDGSDASAILLGRVSLTGRDGFVLNGGEGENQILVNPSPDAQFFVDGGAQPAGGEDNLGLIQGVAIDNDGGDLSPPDGQILFPANANQPVNFQNVEALNLPEPLIPPEVIDFLLSGTNWNLGSTEPFSLFNSPDPTAAAAMDQYQPDQRCLQQRCRRDAGLVGVIRN